MLKSLLSNISNDKNTCNNNNKAITRKSPPSEHAFEKIKSDNFFGFKEGLEREIIILLFSQNVILPYLFTYYIFMNRTKTEQNKSYFFNNI